MHKQTDNKDKRGVIHNNPTRVPRLHHTRPTIRHLKIGDIRVRARVAHLPLAATLLRAVLMLPEETMADRLGRMRLKAEGTTRKGTIILRHNMADNNHKLTNLTLELLIRFCKAMISVVFAIFVI